MSGAAHRGLSRLARRHLSLIEELDCPFGLERSAKFTSRGIDEDRFLASLHRDELGANPQAAVSRLAAAMGLRGALPEPIGESLARADIIHVGHEGADAPVAKLYLEFAGAARRALEAGKPETVVVHLAAKWRADGASPALLTYYRLSPGAGTQAQLTDPSRPWAGSAPAELAEAMLALAHAAGAGDPFLLEVGEEGSERASFDVNLYQAGMEVAQASGPLRGLATALGIAEADTLDFLRRRGGEQLGHISGGRGRDGGYFATLYYGVRARRGTADDE